MCSAGSLSLSSDLLIVGAGTAGLPCALAAAEAGAKVLLVDKHDQIGGTLHLSGGHLSAAGTRLQRELGIDDCVDAHWRDVQRISHGTVREDLARRAVELAPAMVDWLQEQGFEFDPASPRIVYGHEPYDTARTYYGVDEARSLLTLFERLLGAHWLREEEFTKKSQGVLLLLNTEVEELLVRQDQVVGCGARRGAERLHLEAPQTVLASGGYAANPELFEQLDQRPLVSAAAPTSTGDGLVMARSLGAAIVGQDKFLPTFGGLPDPVDPTRAQWRDRPLLVAAEREPWEVWVDRFGRRFVAEDEPSMHLKEEALLALDDLTFWEVFDDRAPDASPNMVVGWSAAKLRSQANQREGIVAADSLEQLASLAGIAPDGLVDTVKRYNRSVRIQRDEERGRRVLPSPIDRPPYYAMRNHGLSLLSFCGVDVDERLQVRRADGSTVGGLYAVGEVLGAGVFCGRSFVGGMMVGPAISLARELGAALASVSSRPSRPL